MQGQANKVGDLPDNCLNVGGTWGTSAILIIPKCTSEWQEDSVCYSIVETVHIVKRGDDRRFKQEKWHFRLIEINDALLSRQRQGAV